MLFHTAQQIGQEPASVILGEFSFVIIDFPNDAQSKHSSLDNNTYKNRPRMMIPTHQ